MTELLFTWPSRLMILRQRGTFTGSCWVARKGRSSDDWIDFNLFGHQIVAHRVDVENGRRRDVNAVDGHDVPVPHFGVVLPPLEWKALASRLKEAEVRFVIEPHTRFVGQPGEQSTMFILDPAGNALDFKSFEHLDQLLAS